MQRLFYKVFLSLCTILLLVSCGKTDTHSETIKVSSDDAQMNAAKQQARDSFPSFKAYWTSHPNAEFSLIKVYFPGPTNVETGEHMWVSPTALDTSPMSGILMDQPDWLKSVKQGDSVTFTLSDVSDWIYVDGGYAAGAYTERLLRQRMRPAEREKHDSNYPFKFEKPTSEPH